MTKHQQNDDKKLYQTLKAIRKSLLNQPRNIELIFKKGYVLYLLKKYEMSADAFTQALEIKPDFAQAYNARSIVNHELRNYCDAISDYNVTYNQATKRHSTISLARQNCISWITRLIVILRRYLWIKIF